MKNVYLTQKQFDKAQTVQLVPNPSIKYGVWKGVTCRLQVAGKVTITTLDSATAKWYGYGDNEEVCSVSCEWFPKELFYKIDKKTNKFMPQTEKNGSLQSNGNTGSDTNLFLKSKIDTVISIFKKHNYTINE